MPFPILAGKAIVDTGFDVANSCRINDGDDAYMHKTPGSEGDRDKWTFSAWVKLGRVSGGTQMVLLNGYSSSSNETRIYFSNQRLEFYNYVSDTTSGKGRYKTDKLFRDPSAWYHIVFTWDSENGTAGNRIRIYVNGTEETSFNVEENPDSGTDTFIADDVKHWLGRSGTGENFDGYLAEVCLCDGEAYAASDFGEFDEDSPTIWKPKDVSGLTFGTTGFYLDFEDSSNLGNDANGGTDFTEVNLAAADQAVDSPTNNFCVINPLQAQADDLTFAEGNCKITNTGNTWRSSYGTFGPSGGKWYFEIKCQASSDYERFGIVDADAMNKQSADGRYDDTGYNSRGYGYGSDGQKTNNGGSPTWGNSWDAGDILACAYDLDNGKLYFSKGGTFQESGDPTSGGTGTGSAYDIDTGYFYIPALAHYGSGSSMEFNFGGCSAFTVSSANQDGNGYGNFEYAVPSGYLALCTKNLGSDGG